MKNLILPVVIILMVLFLRPVAIEFKEWEYTAWVPACVMNTHGVDVNIHEGKGYSHTLYLLKK